MKIAVHDADKVATSHTMPFSERKVFHKENAFPNLVLMKLSASHKARGDTVEWYQPYANDYDRIYSSKVFTFDEDDPYLSHSAIKGGTGYGLLSSLDEAVEHVMPDYSLYGIDYSMGFLTRGCIRTCPWCIVPEKEGKIRKHADIKEFAQHKKVVLLDNNVLAHEHGIAQLDRIAELGLSVDFNQGLDARKIDDVIARKLGKIKWLNAVRLACAEISQIESIETAVRNLRWHNVTPRRYLCYVLVKDVEDALTRVRFLKGLDLDPFAQPYIDPKGTPPTWEQKRFARWVNHKAIFKSC